jgi:excisionase family DNA binding protein
MSGPAAQRRSETSAAEAARRLGLHKATIARACQAGKLQARRTPGGHWRVPSSEIERLAQVGSAAPEGQLARRIEDCASQVAALMLAVAAGGQALAAAQHHLTDAHTALERAQREALRCAQQADAR